MIDGCLFEAALELALRPLQALLIDLPVAVLTLVRGGKEPSADFKVFGTLLIWALVAGLIWLAVVLGADPATPG